MERDTIIALLKELGVSFHEDLSLDELLSILSQATRQTTYQDKHGYVDSLLSSSKAKALELLSKCGYFEIKGKYGQRIIGVWT